MYLLARKSEEETVILILNKNESPVEISLERFEELGLSGKSLRNIHSDDQVRWNDALELKGPGAYMFTTL